MLTLLSPGAELLEIQRQVDRLSAPSSPECVGRLLQLRRQVVLLQFDAAVRHLIRSVIIISCYSFDFVGSLCYVQRLTLATYIGL